MKKTGRNIPPYLKYEKNHYCNYCEKESKFTSSFRFKPILKNYLPEYTWCDDCRITMWDDYKNSKV